MYSPYSDPNDPNMDQELIRSRGITYAWIIAEYGGRKVVIGPKRDVQEAQQWAYLTLEVPFRVFELPTRDKAKATSMLKAELLDRSGDLGGALHRMRHQIPVQPAQQQGRDDGW